jgi:RNA polymerase sigma factor (TIGR02999 family)
MGQVWCYAFPVENARSELHMEKDNHRYFNRDAADGDPANEARLPQLFEQWRSGDRAALAELTPIVYRELHRLASVYMRRERQGHTLQATALVNEAFARLGRSPMTVTDRSHFIGIAAKLMRHILVDHAKARLRLKRGGDQIVESLDDLAQEVPEQVDDQQIQITELDAALTQLEQLWPSAAKAVELHYFGGLTFEQTADAMEVSVSTVGRDLRVAKAWLLKQLKSAN